MLGVHKQRAMVVLLLVSIPVAFIWNNTGHILASLGQDPEISAEAGLYAHFMIPSIFAFALLQCHIRFLQAQNNVVPMMITTGFTTLLHTLTCWMLVFNQLGNMVIRMMVLLSGLLPNPKLETSVLSISLNTYTVLYMIPLGLSGATRVSNELGAGRPQAALLAVYVALFMVAIEGILVATALILGRNFWGYSYSSEEKVVNYVGEMMFLLAGSHFIDGIQSVLSGVVRGSGKQKIGALVNLGAYYLAGIPSGALLAFVYHIGGKGLWTGIIVSLFMQALFLAIIILCTNWEKEAKKATDRVYDSMVPVNAISSS
ncbi:Protein detoxification 12 [Vitis vinifera]|uniref:Protein detoxification 12 n=1 Tax=Vitis vinifera TaxID=29760 RepID=A0A438H572_VITVI|nr:Protein detoxification 12 [Vitis vinifera]